MDPIALSSILPKPRHRRVHTVESLYGDRLSFLVGGMAIVLAAAITAWRIGEVALWVITGAIAVMTVLRLAAFELFLANERHADRHPLFWKRLYTVLGVTHLALIGFWTTIVFWAANDHFSELLSVMAALSYLIGAQGRNFSSLSLVRCQLLACLLPMLLAFYARSPTWAVILSFFTVAFYFAALQTSKRIRAMYRRVIEASEENWRLAHTDALTGLANRISLHSTVQRAMEEQQPFALHIIDLDRFKRVNDTLGHVAGDQLLRQTGASLKRIVGDSGVVARATSDEFSIIQLLNSDPRTPMTLAQEIVDELSRPAMVKGATMPSGCGIGIACYPRDASNFETLSHLADMALFEAKSRGGKCAIEFIPGAPDRAAERLRIENDLRNAVERGEIELHYQPIVENGTWKVVACEALARWNHPMRGPVPPSEFLPVAEDAGLMDALTDQTFAAGCKAGAAWPGIGISINISPSQLCRTDLIELISRSIESAGIDPCRLEIEITENLLLDGRPDVLETLRQIRGLGVRLALDDFGTGYSNLVQIAALPLNKIKLDKSFLNDFGKDERLRAVLLGAVQFIAPLGLEIVLEGVESDEQREFARTQTGISHLQGYAFGRPMEQEEFSRFLASAKSPARADEHLVETPF